MSGYRCRVAIAIGSLTAVANALFFPGAVSGGKPTSAPPSFVVTDLGPWWANYPELINKPGLNNPDGDGILQIAGVSLDQSGNWSATRRSADTMTGAVPDLQTLGGVLARRKRRRLSHRDHRRPQIICECARCWGRPSAGTRR